MFFLNSPLEQFEILRFFDFITNHSPETVMSLRNMIDIYTMVEIETILHQQGLWPAEIENNVINYSIEQPMDCEFNYFFSYYFPIALKISLAENFSLLNEQIIFLQFFFDYCHLTSVVWFELDVFESISSWCVLVYKNILFPVNKIHVEIAGFDSFLVGFDLLDLNPFDENVYIACNIIIISMLKAHFFGAELDINGQIDMLYDDYLSTLSLTKFTFLDAGRPFFFFLFEKWLKLRVLDQQFFDYTTMIYDVLQNGLSISEEKNLDFNSNMSAISYISKSVILIANNLLLTVFFFSCVYLFLFNIVFIQTFLIINYQHIIIFSFINVVKNFITDLLISRVSKIYYYHLFLCLFVCLLFLNVFGLIPYTFVLTAQFCFTFLCSFLYFFALNLTGIRLHGFRLLSLFFPTGAPIFIAPLLVIIEFISYFARVFSLAIRLFANITAGHILLKIIAWFNWSLLQVIFVGILGNVIILILWFLEFFISVLQAYVFIILLCIYLNDVINLH